MSTTARAIYKEGHLLFYDSEMIPEDGTEVIVSFEKQSKGSVFSLRNSWAKYFPKEIDLDEQLKQIRKGWEQEMEKIW